MDKEFLQLARQVCEQSLENVPAQINSAISPLINHQQNLELETDKKLNNLRRDLRDILEAMSRTTSSYPQDTRMLVNREECQSPGSKRSSSSSSITTLHSNHGSGSIAAARRTLGFFPILKNDSMSNFRADDMKISLNNYMKHSLKLDETFLTQFEVNKIWYNSKKCMLFAEFTSFNMCLTIFRGMLNLTGNERVEKYIHPSLRSTYTTLQERAYQLRHSHNLNTRIDYSTNGLILLSKKKDERRWTIAESDVDTQVKDIAPIIPQVDGNLSISSSNLSDPNQSRLPGASTVDEIRPNNVSSSDEAITYNYTLNPSKQSRRLIDNASKAPISVEYKNLQLKDGIRCALTAVIQFNTGVYLTAIKPILDNVNTSWTADIDDWSITCSDVSHRYDKAGKLVLCTQLALNITADTMQAGASHPITVHCYHTNDKLMIQGSSSITPGISSATWFVQSFIEPLIMDHVDTNMLSINQINKNLLSTIPDSMSCNKCRSAVNPSATKVRDQSISCTTCSAIFHKKCTDKNRTRGRNWNRENWYCPNCILTRQYSQVSGPSGTPSIQDHSFRQLDHEATSSEVINHENFPPLASAHLNPAASIFIPTQSTSNLLSQPRKEPNYSIRQRSSNIPVDNPEHEFQKTALDACRSTIAQQEAEIKKLNEGMDVRNKRILQLENQVGVATSYLSSRNCEKSEVLTNQTHPSTFGQTNFFS